MVPPAGFGIVAARVKCFLDGTGGEWMRGPLSGNPACVFTSTSTQHGGQEATLLTMMVPLLHHGMVLVGLPYTEAELSSTRDGGTPYGASHVAGRANDLPGSEDRKTLAVALGQRLAAVAAKLSA